MKIQIKLLLPLLFIIFTASCATTSSTAANKEKKQNDQKLLFEDWKYRGFGQQEPVWLEAAYKNDLSLIKKNLPELSDKEILILTAYGINSDQADRLLKIKEGELPSDFILYDSSWVLLSENERTAHAEGETYAALAVFYK